MYSLEMYSLEMHPVENTTNTWLTGWVENTTNTWLTGWDPVTPAVLNEQVTALMNHLGLEFKEVPEKLEVKKT